MSVMKVLLLIGVALFGGVLFVGCAIKNGHDKAVRFDESVKPAWAQVENQLQRRFDLIPNLEATVKGLGKQEEKIYLGVAEARKAYFQAKSDNSIAGQAKAAGGFSAALSRLLVLKETYPQLKSDQGFLKLQDSVEGSENRLGVERGRYNKAVNQVNTFTRSFFGRFYASLAGVEKAEYFEVTDEAKVVPKIDFSDG